MPYLAAEDSVDLRQLAEGGEGRGPVSRHQAQPLLSVESAQHHATALVLMPAGPMLPD